jgi:hypothetical protein
MPTLRPPARVAVALAGGIAAATLLTGCVGPVQDLVERGVEDTVESASGGQVDLSGELPDDFPDSIPVIDGTIELAGGAEGMDGWVVVLSSEASDPLAEARTALEGAGFGEDPTLSDTTAGGSVYGNGEFMVILAGEGGTVTYTVAPTP